MNETIVLKIPPGVEVSDGYHTFTELYEHRCRLWIAVCRGTQSWRSRKHSDRSSFDGWFVLGIGHAPGHQLTYHLPDRMWDDCAFAETLEKAPPFDGHTPADVLERLKSL